MRVDRRNASSTSGSFTGLCRAISNVVASLLAFSYSTQNDSAPAPSRRCRGDWSNWVRQVDGRSRESRSAGECPVNNSPDAANTGSAAIPAGQTRQARTKHGTRHVRML